MSRIRQRRTRQRQMCQCQMSRCEAGIRRKGEDWSPLIRWKLLALIISKFCLEYYQKTAFSCHFFNMATQAAGGGQLEIRKEHIDIHKITNFQNTRVCQSYFEPNDCTYP